MRTVGQAINALLTPVFVILDTVSALLQIGGQYYVAAAKSAEITGATPFFTLGVSVWAARRTSREAF